MKKWLLKVGLVLVSVLAFGIFSGAEFSDHFWFPEKPTPPAEEPRDEPVQIVFCNPIPLAPPFGWPFAMHRSDYTGGGCSFYTQYNPLALGLDFAFFFVLWSVFLRKAFLPSRWKVATTFILFLLAWGGLLAFDLTGESYFSWVLLPFVILYLPFSVAVAFTGIRSFPLPFLILLAVYSYFLANVAHVFFSRRKKPKTEAKKEKTN